MKSAPQEVTRGSRETRPGGELPAARIREMLTLFATEARKAVAFCMTNEHLLDAIRKHWLPQPVK
jgi:hypothetical protein